MTPSARAQLVRLERKAFRAARAPNMPLLDAAGVSTRPWGGGMRGIGLTGAAGPSRRALDFWKRSTGQTGARRRKRGPFALATPTL